MPTLKARIFSSHPGNAEGLAQALKQQGYLVEILRPEQTPGQAADLEIVLETCAARDALRRAAELAQEFEADVAVAPGTLVASPSVEQSHAGESGAFVDGGPEPTKVVPGPEASFHPQPARRESEADQTAELPAMASDAAEPEGAGMAGFFERAIPTATLTLTAWAVSAREAFYRARAQSREYREHALTRLAFLRAAREKRLLELTERRIEAQEQASQLVTARKNAAAYLSQLQHESGGTIRPADRSDEPSPGNAVRPWRVHFEGLMERVRPIRWDAALAGLASAGALFAVGLAVASFSAKPNLTMGNEPPAATAPAPAPASHAPRAAATTGVSAAPQNPTVRTQSRKPSPALPGSRAGRNRPDASRDAQSGNDVVVRHLSSPAPTPKQQAQGWKHFSDMDH